MNETNNKKAPTIEDLAGDTIKKKGLSSLSFSIEKYEFKKLIPLFIMAIMMTYIYNTLRATKDAMIVPIVGAEVISSLKLWAVMPTAVLFLAIYSKLSDHFSKKQVFYTLTFFFIGFFMFFGFVLYPIHQLIHPDLSGLIEEFPRMKWPLLMISNWSFSLFYVMAELCGNVTIFILFWQIANDINTVKEAKKYYAFFILISHLGHIMAGATSKSISSNLASGVDVIQAWGDNIKVLMIFVSISLMILATCFAWIQKKVVTDSRLYRPRKSEINKVKIKMTFLESVKFIMSSKYIGLIAAMILCYGVSINVVEGVWKSQVKLHYPTSTEYSGFMGTFQMYAGSFNIFVALIGAAMIRKTTWFACALVTPITILITGIIFFALIMAREELNYVVLHFGVTAVFAAVFIGAVQNIVSKGAKYSIFDMTKEIAYIPLSEELRTKGKAAADLIGHKLGKSGGAFLQWLLLSLIPNSNLMSLTGYFIGIFAIMMTLWLWAVWSLNKEFLAKVKQYEKDQL